MLVAIRENIMPITREYTRLDSRFWIGDTGRRLRAAGKEAQVVALYLLSSPHSNMLGAYYVSVLSISHETGLTIEEALKGLQSCIDEAFCSYDAASEFVWVHEMARHQIAEALSETDKRAKGIQNAYNRLPENPWLAAFFDRYAEAFNMQRKRIPKGEPPSPFDGAPQAPSELHASQAQAQAQQRHARESGSLDAAAVAVALIGWERERKKQARGIAPAHPGVIELAARGVTLDELRAAYDAAVADRDATDDPTPVNAGFVLTFVDKRRRPPKPKRDDWQRTESGISRRASELGVVARPGESFDALRERVQAHA
jgi:hypothetical protein